MMKAKELKNLSAEELNTVQQKAGWINWLAR